MTKRYYEDFEIGDSAETPMGRTITESDVYTQSGLAGSYNPIHTDREYMADSDYGGRIVQNTLLMTVSSGLRRHLPWDPEIIAAYGRDNVRFTNPVFIDDTVRLEAEILDKQERDANGGVVTVEEKLYKQTDDLVLTGETLLLVSRTPEE
jgi:acyl dehydratase